MCNFHDKIVSDGNPERSSAMLTHFHKQVTTTSKVRAAIHASGEPASALAQRSGTTEQTI
jgi:hypothetical protein